ncbi:hypothetical protein E7T06_06035 [Deinococcus sp. Arct2-2]|uniref:hypothetical protein n=1 Tax=Deinococcus sp. Arct2-2 TaxID=2568653 RepID=UPI0010A504C6|nr:hypothetical protein [Deinococcus sp. Arct2-2]THF70696.1 hypothetical protein E7T06_06035 [Deinococcus sp. Arct2-2]
MNRTLSLLALATLGFVSATTLTPPAAAPSTPSASARPIVVPRQKIGLTCNDTYFKSPRQNYLLLDESYPLCTLRLPLALRQRWPGARTFYFIPRVSATLYAKDSRGNGKWLPLSPLVNPGADALHRAVDSATYEAVELTGQFKKLSDVAGQNKADTVSAGGKLTVCVAPVRVGETPCVTFDITARYKVYTR